MTESQWLQSPDPLAMLRFLETHFPARKLFLLGCAWWRRAWGNGAVEEAQHVVEIVERIADGTVSQKRLRKALEAINAAYTKNDGVAPDRGESGFAIYLAGVTTRKDAWDSRMWWAHMILTERLRVGLIREVFDNPFQRVAVAPLWLTLLVTSLAQAAYEERNPASGYLDADRLAVLSDALEEAGCTKAAILDHLRSPGPHYRGCWAVDLLLDKH